MYYLFLNIEDEIIGNSNQNVRIYDSSKINQQTEMIEQNPYYFKMNVALRLQNILEK